MGTYISSYLRNRTDCSITTSSYNRYSYFDHTLKSARYLCHSFLLSGRPSSTGETFLQTPKYHHLPLAILILSARLIFHFEYSYRFSFFYSFFIMTMSKNCRQGKNRRWNNRSKCAAPCCWGQSIISLFCLGTVLSRQFNGEFTSV